MSSNELTKRKPFWKILTLVALAAATLRLTLFLAGPGIDVRRAYEPDSDRYIELADSLGHRHAFALDHGEAPGTVYYPVQSLRAQVLGQAVREPGVWPEGIRTPGYPVFLAVFMASPLGLKAAIVVQCILSALGAMIVAWIALSLKFPALQAAIAGLVMAIHPADIASANALMSESLFAFVMISSLGLILKGVSDRTKVKWTPLIIGSLLLGSAALIRPVSLLLGPAVAVWVILAMRNRAALAACAVMIVLTVLPGAAWCLRNFDAGLGLRLSTVTTVHVARTAAFMPMNDRGTFKYPEDFWPYYDEFFAEVHREIRPGEDPDSAVVRVANRRIRDNPKSYARLMLRSASKTLTDHSTGGLYGLLGLQYTSSGLKDKLDEGRASPRDFLSASLLVPLAWTLWNILLAVLTVLGFARLAIRKRWADLTLLAGIMAYFILGAQYHGDERMRVPFLGVQAIVVAAAFMGRMRPLADATTPQPAATRSIEEAALPTRVKPL